ncbi:hypothetical protein LBMAG42_55020 [Deltaproteobacteria bacterium]|nr:hypothetical protein LBMAG42_55020 [Deltaproteobacteria bacterium]
MCVPVPESRDGVPYGAPGARAHRRRYHPTAGVSSLLQNASSPKLYTYGYDALRLPAKVYMLVTGPAGSGKSTLATSIALTLALQGLRVLCISAEEGAGPTTVRRLRQAMAWLGDPCLPSSNPLISDKRALRDVHDEVVAFERDGGDAVVLDSLTVLGASPQWVAEVATGLSVVAISHMNGKSGPMGGERVAYDSDVHIRVESFQASLLKTRWCVDGAPRSWPVDDVWVAKKQSFNEVIPFPSRPRMGS